MADARRIKKKLRGMVVYVDEARDQEVPERPETDTEDCNEVAKA
jgi:hypothetical protein